jgi:membrane protein implicated in regulation of membrane protease activity
MTWWIWVLFGLFLMVLEMFIPSNFYLMFFGAGALIVGSLVAMFGMPLWMQWLLFTVFSILAAILFQKKCMLGFRSHPEITGTENLVGKTALVLDDMAPNAIGKVELQGTSWNVRNVGTSPLTRGQHCHVEHVDGLTLSVRE